VENKT